MRKGFIITVLTAIALMFVVNVNAQQRATGEALESMLKHEKVLDKELKKKAIKQARKEAKALKK